MTIYEEVIVALKDHRTIATHITNLGKILNKTEDHQLKMRLGNLITSLQRSHANPKVKNKSTPGSLYNSNSSEISNLVQFCNTCIGTKKEEWKILAERNGWGPKI